ncbi:DUF3570 domain-containing protein [Ascidiimonas aurantiaca]|uniref:DUF3570 domain-containing protein n=1 Tax=Ascidiimonas aurantiaca TaxID=1685432 RepID=UPI0030EE8633
MRKHMFFLCFMGSLCMVWAQETNTSYKQKVLETAEIDLLFSYYEQDGVHAAVTGGEGSEELTDVTPTIIVSVPLSDDHVLTFDTGISAYTSASSSNINPFDGTNRADPFIESSGASRSDVWAYFNPSLSYSSDDRNHVLTANVNIAAEYDYFSVGFGGSYTRLFNEKNTELGVSAQVFFDTWNPQYPIELREGFFDDRITGNGTYAPVFNAFDNERRNSYSLSFSFSQIMTKKLQASLFFDLVLQEGLLSTPHQRVYFGDVNDFFIQEFQLADDVERLPDTRFKVPLGGRLNYYVNERIVIRNYYRYYLDDWGITSHTLNIEVPVKLNDRFTVYPMYRYYHQTAADYFYEKEQALSTMDFYTSDYDLSGYDAHQYGAGITYKDIFTRARIWKLGLKSIDLRFNHYDRSDGLTANILSFGMRFIGN